MICDIHAHLERFTPEELIGVLERAHAAGVTDIIMNSLEPKTFAQLSAIRNSYDGPIRLHLAAGFYPLAGLEADVAAGFLPEAELDAERILGFLETARDIVAIGEVGLDFTETTDETRARDEALFERVLRIAEERDLPVIIHSRRAEARVIELLEAHPNVRAVLHCFSGKHKLIERALERPKTWFSVPVIVEHSEQFQKLVETVPGSKLLTETDAPFLAPKGADHSEPAHIARSIPIIAQLKGLEERDCELILYENARKLFWI
jgi:TatD DNase family protein